MDKCFEGIQFSFHPFFLVFNYFFLFIWAEKFSHDIDFCMIFLAWQALSHATINNNSLKLANISLANQTLK